MVVGLRANGSDVALAAARILDEELQTRRELEALCTPSNRVSSIATCMSMTITEVLVRWRSMGIAPAVPT
jgi:hypothetical protein